MKEKEGEWKCMNERRFGDGVKVKAREGKGENEAMMVKAAD